MQCVWSPLNEMSITHRTNNSFFLKTFSLMRMILQHLFCYKQIITLCGMLTNLPAASVGLLPRQPHWGSFPANAFFLPLLTHPPTLSFWLDVLHKWLVCCNWIGCKKIINWYFTPREVRLPYLEGLLWRESFCWHLALQGGTWALSCWW